MRNVSTRPAGRPTRTAFALSLALLAWAQSPQVIREATTLQLHQPVGRELGPGQTDVFAIDAAARQFASVTVKKKGVDATLLLTSPSGASLLTVDGLNSTLGMMSASWIAESSGRYQISVIKSAASAETGKYEIELTGLREPAEADRIQIQAEAKFNSAAAQDRAGDKDSRLAAVKLYEESAALWRGLNARYQEALCLHTIGVLYVALGQTQTGLDYHQRALPIWQAIVDKAGEAGTLNSIGTVYNKLGDNQKALDTLQQALTIDRAIGDPSGEAKTLQNLGLVYNELGEQRKALDYYQQSMAIKHTLGDRAGEAATLVTMGVVYTRIGDQHRALEYFEQALPIRRAFKDRAGEGIVLHDIGLVYWNLSELPKALDFYQQALAIRRGIGDLRGEGSTLGNMGLIFDNRGEKEKALGFYQQALAISRSTGDRKREAGMLSNIGGIYFDLGDTQKALDYFQQALPIERAVGDRLFEAETLGSIGDVYVIAGERQKGLEYFKQSLSISQAIEYRSGEALALNNLGDTYSALGDHRQALEYFEKATAITRETGDRSRFAYALVGMGTAYDGLGEKSKARDSLNEALSIRREIRERPGEAEALHQLARVEFGLGNLQEARTLAESARNILESLRSQVVNQALRASYFGSVQDYYRLETDVLMKLQSTDPSRNYQASAFETSESARARILIETLGEAHADIRQGVDPTLLDRERTLQAQLNTKELSRMQTLSGKHTPEEAAAAEKTVSELTSQYEDIRAQIRANSPHYAALVSPRPLKLEEIQKEVLDADTLLLEYSLGDKKSYLWIVSPTSIASFELPKRSEIEQAARSFYDGLTKPGVAAPDGSGQVLSRMLLADAAPLLSGKRLLIVADGALQYLPFQALTDPDGSGVPLVVHHEVVNAPSASTIASLRRENGNRKPAPKMLAVLADPVFSSDDARLGKSPGRPAEAASRDAADQLERSLNDIGVEGLRLSRLPGTRREAAGIAALVPEGERKQALDFDASRETLTSPEIGQYRILHLATHGLLNGVHPELSGLVLSLVDGRGAPQDGFLRLNEVYNLKLSADLVVLSACQTGLGKETRGEGLVGLTRGFMYAGAPRVVASLWKVDDRATAELMKQFYSAMLGKESLRPAAALRAAQIKMSKTKGFEDPYYWAAFTLQGEWR